MCWVSQAQPNLLADGGFTTPLVLHLPFMKYPAERSRPTLQAIGTPHQIPSVPILTESQAESGIRMIQSERMVKSMGTKVSPAHARPH